MLRMLTALLPVFLSGSLVVDAFAQTALLEGAFNEAQAVRGQAMYYQHCLACHGESMNGVDQAPPLSGPQFGGNWRGETLWALVERMATMPPDKPGTLSRQELVDTLAYVLWYNGLPLGDAVLPAQQDILSAMTFELPPLGE
jgi:mono/diheme cytochrome c family protein